MPKVIPKVNWEVVSTTTAATGEFPVITKQLVGHVPNSSYPQITVGIQLSLTVAPPNEYHWMAGNHMKYAGPMNWNDLPVDSHQLVALCAPRPVFIDAGATNGDGWVDAKGMFLAAAGAGPVYRLLGKKGMGTAEFPPIETGLMDGDVAFRQHKGGHTPGPNRPVFLEFTARYFEKPAGRTFRTSSGR
jgi:hypothetical protein